MKHAVSGVVIVAIEELDERVDPLPDGDLRLHSDADSGSPRRAPATRHRYGIVPREISSSMRFQWLQDKVQATCPVCGHGGEKDALLTTDHVLAGYAPIVLLRCLACAAAFLQNLATPDYEHEMPEIVDYYVEQGGGIDIMVAPLMRLPSNLVRRCLEVGCGFGFALDFGRHAFGWDVRGVDPSALAAAGASALRLPITNAYLSAELDLGSEPFDIVLCSEILEHVADPHTLLAAIRSRLSPEGLLVLSTPNLAIVGKDTAEGALARALSPGLHLVLYHRDLLRFVLERAGFAAVEVEESPETLLAFASASPEALARLQPVTASTRRALLLDYFTTRADEAPPASATACGFAYRHFKECVNGGMYEAARESRARLARIYHERFGLDLDSPGRLVARPGAPLAFNLTGALYFSGILELNSAGPTGRAAEYFEAAIAAGSRLMLDQCPLGLHDGETEALLQQSRKHLPVALAATDPERAVREVEALARRSSGGELLPESLLRETRAQTFVRLVNAGAYAAAARLAPQIARQLETLDEECDGCDKPGVLDPLYCLAMLALQQGREREAAMLFGRLYRTARASAVPEHAEIAWSARYHEAISLRRVGDERAARTALADIARCEEGPGVPPVPEPIAASARKLLSEGTH